MKLEAKIALHHIFLGFKSSQGSSFLPFAAWITLLGISLGIMSLIVVMSVMNGFERELRRGIIGQESHIILYRKDKGIKEWQKLKNNIQKVDPQILEISPITYNEGLFIHENQVAGGVLEGVQQHQSIQSLMQKSLAEGGCLTGAELARKLHLKKGDILKMMLPGASWQEPSRIFEFKMLDTFESGLYDYSSRYVYALLSDMQKKAGWGNTISAFKVRIKDPDRARLIARKIRSQIPFPFFIRTWMDINRNIFAAIKIEKVVMAIILSCIIVVSFFNVVSSLIMMVLEKKKDISILKTMGMTKNRIAHIFLWHGALIAGLGIVIGIFLALGACELLGYFKFIHLSPEIYYLSYLPVQIQWTEVLAISIGLFGASLIVSFYPARKAAALHPIEGIRYE